MWYTEEEAKQKWCPQVRKFGTSQFDYPGSGLAAAGYNRSSKENCNCRASSCMMWRKNNLLKMGYCGLAGVPS